MMNNKEAIEDIYNRCSNLDKKKDKFFIKKIHQRNPNFKYVAVILSFILLSSSISVGNNFFNYHSKSNIGYLDEGVYTNIANNKMQNISMNYQKSNKVGVKVTNVLISDSKIYIVFDFKFYKQLKENVNLIEFPDMLITDENNNILYCMDPEKYKTYINNSNAKSNTVTYDNLSILTTSYNSQFLEKNQKNIRYLLILNSDGKFPQSSKLNINFNKILLLGNLTYENSSDNKVIKEGNWNLEINLN